ncbi:hypothetical protein GCM10007160_16810 [Litchfieldella qijiaojingensis]|uniref:Uncharacterized protein n=1 Tax=Litchfieldella qijiaojingensis TaxID=980347 RepID=A0ABQ2YN88_9GAMM|nr:hypothetical protein [Halomonas qijiaojingensis]GGX90008.1 hypothetical protein GCM10007160_16810 [Halomonas qijiaojingensis]
MIDTTPDWEPVTQGEADELAPFTLDAKGLDDEAVYLLMTGHKDILRRAILVVAKAVGRMPTDDEILMVAREVVRWLNENRVPELHAASMAGKEIH